MADILTPDLCVIGAGAGGLALVEAARAMDLSVVLVEQGKLGGNALNTGAVPARALSVAADRAQLIRTASQFGVSAEGARISFRRVHDHVTEIIAGLTPHSAIPRYEALGAEIVTGTGHFIDSRTLAVDDTHIRARRFVIATGARPVLPDIPGLSSVSYFTTDTILDNTRKLTHLVVIGASPRAVELAQAYARLGTEVTIVAEGELLPGFDRELVDVVLRRLAEDGVRIHARASVEEIQPRSMGTGVVIRTVESQLSLDVSHILVATARRPVLDALDLDKAGIRMSRSHKGHLQLKGLRTSNRRVLAIGDAATLEGSVPSAALDAQVVTRHLLFGLPARRNERAVPRFLGTDPAIAEIGLNETQARRHNGLGFRVSRWAFAENDRARIEADTEGYAKLITDRFGRLLGASIVGTGAEEVVAPLALAIANRLTMRHLLKLVAPYPSRAEIVTRLGAEFLRHERANPLLGYWTRLVRLLG